MASITAGSAALDAANAAAAGAPNPDGDSVLTPGGPDEMVVFRTGGADVAGLSETAASSAISSFGATGAQTSVVGDDGRNLPSAIGFEIIPSGTDNRDLVVVTEAREFDGFGAPPAFPALENGSVSVFDLALPGNAAGDTAGTISTIPAGNDIVAVEADAVGTPGSNQLTACWLTLVPGVGDDMIAYVSNAINASIGSFNITQDGTTTLLNSVAATADRQPFTAGVDNINFTAVTGEDPPAAFAATDGYIDIAQASENTDNGAIFIYQLAGLGGNIDTFTVTPDGNLELLGNGTVDSGALPDQNSQGIVAF